MDTKIGKRREKTVLIIEDESDIRNFIVRVLELEGYNVLEAGDGTRGLEIVKKNSISLVLLDLLLPDLKGWAVLREIKHNPEFNAIPVVVLTAIAETIQRKKTLRMGADGYLVKPLSAHSLSRAVADVLEGKNKLNSADRKKSPALIKTGDKKSPVRRPLPMTL